MKQILDSSDINEHCALFCKLDNSISQFTWNEKKEIGEVLEKYLLNLKTDKEQVDIILGDLLGEHFDLRVSLPILKRQVEFAEYKEGRVCSLYGLYRAYLKTENMKIRRLIEKRVKEDNSKHVKEYAEWILKRIKEGLKG